MVRLTKIYTRGGDLGETSLGDGTRLTKFDKRIQAIGEVDEANATLGLVFLHQDSRDEVICRIQNDLFDVGADLCLPNDHKAKLTLRIQKKHVDRLEQEIDILNKALNPLESFVLPGGSAESSALHLARTVIRRAERAVCWLADETFVNPQVISYLNRLSDYLFVRARYCNDKGQRDILWRPGASLKSES